MCHSQKNLKLDFFFVYSIFFINLFMHVSFEDFQVRYYGSSMPLPLSFIRMLEQLYKCLVFCARIWSSLLPQLYRYLIVLVLLFKKMSFFNKRDSLKPLPAFRISIKASMNGSSRLPFCSKVANYSLMGTVS